MKAVPLLFLTFLSGSSFGQELSAIPYQNSDTHYQAVLAAGEQAQSAEIQSGINAMSSNWGWQRLPPYRCEILVYQATTNGLVCYCNKLIEDLDTAEEVPIQAGVLVVKNYPGRFAVHMPLDNFTARRIGTLNISGTGVPVFDCAPPSAEELAQAATNAILAKAAAAQKKKAGDAAALKFNQDAADKGDAYGLFRMGERYRDGGGVDKDIAKAKEYFEKSAATGNADAALALKKLSASNP